MYIHDAVGCSYIDSLISSLCHYDYSTIYYTLVHDCDTNKVSIATDLPGHFCSSTVRYTQGTRVGFKRTYKGICFIFFSTYSACPQMMQIIATVGMWQCQLCVAVPIVIAYRSYKCTFFCISAYFLTVQTYKCMCLTTRAYNRNEV